MFAISPVAPGCPLCNLKLLEICSELFLNMLKELPLPVEQNDWGNLFQSLLPAVVAICILPSFTKSTALQGM